LGNGHDGNDGNRSCLNKDDPAQLFEVRNQKEREYPRDGNLEEIQRMY